MKARIHSPGIIAAGRAETAEAGAAMLRDGGNAIDAAVAAAFAACVAEPTLVSPGGGGYALVAGRTLPARIYDFFCDFPGLDGPAPQRLDFFPVSVSYGPAHQTFHIGRGSVAVPGLIAGLCQLHAEAGQLPLADVLRPTIELARVGVPLGKFGAYVGRLLEPIFRHDPAVARLFGAPDHFLSPRHLYRNPDLADTLAALAHSGPALFYRGEIAQAVLSDQRRHGGLLTNTDLAGYRVIVRQPLRLPYRHALLLTNPPPSRGGALIAFSLSLLAGYDLAAMGSAQRLRLLVEVMRETNLARPLFDATGDAGQLLDPRYLDHHRRALAARLAQSPAPAPREPLTPPGHNNTTHISALDEAGNIIALSMTAGESPGFLIPGTGLILNNMLGEADLHPAGFHQGQPGQRIGSMMAPTLVTVAGTPTLALGSGGANRIRTAILQVLVHGLDLHHALPDAVTAPRIHYEDGVVQVEGGPAPHGAGWLRRWGYRTVSWTRRHMFFGGVHAVGRDEAGTFQGAGDPRRSGAARLISADVSENPEIDYSDSAGEE